MNVKSKILRTMVVAIFFVVLLSTPNTVGTNKDMQPVPHKQTIDTHLRAGIASVSFTDQPVATCTPNTIDVVKESIQLYTEEECYMLAKLVMAEAEGEDNVTKLFVIATVLNRVQSDEFPDTVEEVIFQNSNGVYQFSPIVDGRYDRVEPNEECWQVVEEMMDGISEGRDMSYGGILYFESSDNDDNWHNRNLEFVFKRGKLKFYK